MTTVGPEVAADGSQNSSNRRRDIPGPVLLKDLAGNAWHLYRSSARSLIGMFLIGAVVQFAIFAGAAAALSAVELPSGGLALLAFLFFSVGLPSILYGYVVAATSVFLADKIVGTDTAPVAAFGKVRPRAGAIVVAALYSAIIVSFSLFIVGPALGQFIMLPFLIGPPVFVQVIALEDQGISRGWKRTKDLLSGQWGRIPLYLLTIAMGVGLLDFLVIGAVVSGFSGNDSIVARIAIAAAELVGACLTLPFVASCQLVGYFDLRARKENFDKQALLAERVGA